MSRSGIRKGPIHLAVLYVFDFVTWPLRHGWRIPHGSNKFWYWAGVSIGAGVIAAMTPIPGPVWIGCMLFMVYTQQGRKPNRGSRRRHR